MNQKELAKIEMINWLSYPNELGKAPAKIEITNEFDYINMKYYIFKFKKNIFDSKWLIGVCGGYENNSLENCGHTFSNYTEYNHNNEKDDAIKLIETVREYWKNKLKNIEGSL